MEKKDTIVSIPVASVTQTAHAPTTWVSANFSEHWYRDAANEAAKADGENSTRREIIFAASFLESYIFEWARLICGLDRINEYFLPVKSMRAERYQRSLQDKWKKVPGELHLDSIISTAPKLDFSELGLLVELRNGLLHARASRPSTDDLPEKFRPVPAPGELATIKHGWACSVAKSLVQKLHKDLGTPSPSYIEV